MADHTQELGTPREANECQAASMSALVQLVADKVYAMWLRDLEIEKERQRMRVDRHPVLLKR